MPSKSVVELGRENEYVFQRVCRKGLRNGAWHRVAKETDRALTCELGIGDWPFKYVLFKGCTESQKSVALKALVCGE